MTWGIPAQQHIAEAEHHRGPHGSTTWRERVILKLRVGSRRKTFKFTIPRSDGDGMWLEIPQHLWGRVTPFRDVEPFVRPSSAFDQLRKACLGLSQRFPWRPWDAVWFAMTNTPPFVPPIQPGIRRTTRSGTGEEFRRDVLTLEISPWLAADTVRSIYRAYQRHLITGRNRELGAKSLDLFQFVTVRKEARAHGPSWEKLRREWNRAHREWSYGDYRNFRKDFNRARRAILLPEERVVPTVRLW
jgi:hypothetical protein